MLDMSSLRYIRFPPPMLVLAVGEQSGAGTLAPSVIFLPVIPLMCGIF